MFETFEYIAMQGKIALQYYIFAEYVSCVVFNRKSGLFASLTASLSAARSGIQGFLEK